MFAEMLIKRLPLLIHVFGISLAAYLARTKDFRSFDFNLVMMSALTIFSTISVLTSYAPVIKDAAYQGMGYGIGLNMVGGGKNSKPICEDCKNPYSNDEIAKTVRKAAAPLNLNLNLFREPKAEDINSNLPSGPGHNIIKQPKEVNVKKVTEPGSLCTLLEKAGYNPQWTHEDITTMYATPEGKKLLQAIDKKVRKKTGIPVLTVKNLNQCYPHFYQSYSCQKSNSSVNPSVNPNPNAKSIPNEQPEDLELATSCHWPSLVKELNDDITVQFNKQIASAEAESTKQKLLSTLQYLRNRSELEVKNLINLFQSKSSNSWSKFYVENKIKEPKGYHIKGTSYYIPWSLLHKYTLCFGINEQ